MGGVLQVGDFTVGGFSKNGEGFSQIGRFLRFLEIFHRWGDISQVGGIPPFSDILPVFANFRNIGGEAHRTTKFLDRRRFEISKYVRVH